MFKNILKFLGGGAAIMIAGVGVLYGLKYFQYIKSPEYKAAEDIKRLEKQYAEDPYGGNTPEETLRLFIEALKKGDTDLAAKYFILDKQEQWREDLAKIKDKGLLVEMVRDLGNTKLKVSEDTARFTLVREQDLPSELVMHKNTLSNKWKITEL